MRKQLSTVLASAPSNEFSPAWRQSLEEMGIADLLGNPLSDRLERILSTNEITPAAAADEIAEVQDRVKRLVASLNQGSSALVFFMIGREELAPGEFEVGFLIPREEVDEGLEELGSESIRLRQIIGPFSELAGEGRGEVQVRSISSSAFQIFLDSAPATAVLITLAMQRLLAIYQQILDIRQKHRELSEGDEVPEEALKPLVDHANSKMTDAISEIVEEVVEKASLDDEARLNELRTDLKRQLAALADRIDRGFDVEVRAGEIPESTEDYIDETDADRRVREAAETVLKSQSALEFMNVSGKPILELEEPEESSDGADEDPPPSA